MFQLLPVASFRQMRQILLPHLFLRIVYPAKNKEQTVHPSIELLNLWEDFRKVVKFIDENHCWLNPLLERITKKEPPLKDFQHLREGERTCY